MSVSASWEKQDQQLRVLEFRQTMKTNLRRKIMKGEYKDNNIVE